MKKFLLIALVVAGMACGAGSAKAAPQGGGTEITVTNNGQPASGVSLVLDIANKGKTATSTGMTDSQGSPSNVLDLSNEGKVRVDVYVEVCQNGQHIVIVNAGMPPPDDGSCHMRRKIGAFWLTGSDTIKIDIGTGTATATSNGGASSGGSMPFNRFEIFGGYSFLRVDEDGQGFGYNGGSGSIDVNLSRYFGIVGDFGGYHRGESDGSDYIISALVGPKLYFNEGRFTPFVEAMFGGSHLKEKSCTALSHGGFSCSADTANAKAFAVGGGLDFKLTNNIGVRVIQFDDVITKFFSGTQNNARISTGITINF